MRKVRNQTNNQRGGALLGWIATSLIGLASIASIIYVAEKLDFSLRIAAGGTSGTAISPHGGKKPIITSGPKDQDHHNDGGVPD